MYTGDLPAASNRAGYYQLFSVADEDTDEAVDLSAASIAFEIRDPNTGSPLLCATTVNGKAAVVDVGTFSVSFAVGEMNQLCAGIYDVGCVITNAGSDPVQFIAGTIAIWDGIVSQ